MVVRSVPKVSNSVDLPSEEEEGESLLNPPRPWWLQGKVQSQAWTRYFLGVNGELRVEVRKFWMTA